MEIELEWWPQPKQLDFLRACGMAVPFDPEAPEAPEAEVIGYGGAAGGGKSDGLLGVGTVAAFMWPGCSIGYFRRTYPELEGAAGAIPRSHQILEGVASWHGGRRCWTFPTGSQLRFCHCQREADVHNYQSNSFDVLLIDEATHFTWFQTDYLFTRNRATVEGSRPFAAMGTNPGGVGHLWFKDKLVDGGPWGEVFEADTETGGKEKRKFIPARLSDNQILESRDPGYRRRLEARDEDTRRALLEGDWDVFIGQVFGEWRRDVHVVKPFEIPKKWIRWRAVDWGYAAPFCCLWFARDLETRMTVVYRELYQAGLTDPEQAEAIVEATGDKEKIAATWADPSMWTKKTTERQTVSTADVYRKHKVPLRKADNHRLIGKRRVHDALADMEYKDDLGEVAYWGPGLQVFENCTNLIRTLPALPYDLVRVEDVDTNAEDHAYDALRYGLSAKVAARRKPEKGRDVWKVARRN